MVLYRGLADDLALMDWLQKYIFPAEAKTVSPEFVRAGTRLAALEMIQSGTTAYADMYYFEEEIAKATKEAGIRGVLGQTIIQFPVPDAKTPADGIARATAFIRQWSGDDLIVPAIAPHSMYTLDTATLKEIRATATRERAPVIIHLAETDRRDQGRARQVQGDADAVSRVDRLLGRPHARGARRSRHARRHCHSREASRRPVPQPREQHEAGERHFACSGASKGWRRRWTRHRWGRQQQRPRHVRGDAASSVPAQADEQGSERATGQNRAPDGHNRRGARARPGS